MPSNIYASWQCQQCGEPIGWLGRLFLFLNGHDKCVVMKTFEELKLALMDADPIIPSKIDFHLMRKHL